MIGKYVFNSFIYKDAKTFSKVCYYSINSKSFVAYRSDNNLAYIIFENGEYDKYPFKYVGEELYGTRAVKGQNDRWVYYNTLTRRVLVSIKKGLQLKDEEKLVKQYNHDYYIVCKDNLYYKILYHDFEKHKSYNLRDKIEYFEESCNGNIIGKLYGKKIYFLFSSKNPIETIRYYTTKPKYNSERNVYIAKKGDSYVIIEKKRDVSNYQWETDDFVFYKDYVLNRTNTGVYKIYCLETGFELQSNYSNVKYSSKDDCIIVDTASEIKKKIYYTDLDELKSLLLNILKTSKKENTVTYLRRNIIKNVNSNDSIDECSNDDCLDNGELDNAVVSTNNESKIVLPNRIDFIIFVDKIGLTNDGTHLICPRRADKDLFTGCNICWIIREKLSIAITERKHAKTYKLIYYRENVDLGVFKNYIAQNYFYKLSVNIVDEETLFQEIERWEYHNTIKSIEADETKNREKTYEEPDGGVNACDNSGSINNINRYGTFTPYMQKLMQRGEKLREIQKKLESRECVENREKNNDEINSEYTFPGCINHITFVDKIKFLLDKKYLVCSQIDDIQVGEYICYIINEKKSIAIAKYLFGGCCQIIYYKENVDLQVFKKGIVNNYVFKHPIIDFCDEESFYKQLDELEYNNTEIEIKVDDFEKNTARIETTSIEKRVLPQICKKNNEIKQTFPDKINFIAFVDKINIPDRGDFIQYRVIDDIRVGEYVCWIVKENNSIAITKLIFGITHKILYYEENISIDLSKNNVGYKGFYKCFLNIPNKKEDELFKELKVWKSKYIRGLEGDTKYDSTNEVNSSEQVSSNNSVSSSKSDVPEKKIKITFEGKDYILGVNDVCNEEIFYRRRFVLKNNLIAILLDNTDKIKEENNKIIYEIIGEGKDKRFNQDFISPANRTIRDNSKQIILFKRDISGILHFVDNVVCEGYYEVDDEKDKRDKKRKIIIFILRSLMRTDTILQSTTNN